MEQSMLFNSLIDLNQVNLLTLSAPSCNSNCHHCLHTGRSTSPRPSLKHVDKVLAEMDEKKGLLIRGMEPTTHPEFFHFLDIIGEKNFPTVILESNGRAFAYPDFTREISNSVVDECRIYFWGPDRVSHDFLTRSPGSFDQSIEGYTRLKNATAVVPQLMITPNLIRVPQDNPPIRRVPDFLQALDTGEVSLVYVNQTYRYLNTVDQFFFHQACRPLYHLIDDLKRRNIRLRNNLYPDSVDFRTLYDGVPMASEEGSSNGRLLPVENPLISKYNFEARALNIRNLPSTLFMELTMNCNFDCVMCPRPDVKLYRNELDMPLTLFKKIADELFPYAEYVDLRGFGESTIMKNFDAYLDYALQFSCRFGLITNLSNTNEELWERLVRSHFFLGVSIDGARKKTLESIRLGSNHERTFANLELIVELMKKYRSPHENLKVIYVVQESNYQEIPEIIDKVGRIGVKHITFSPCRASDDDDVFDRDDIFKNPKLIEPYFEEGRSVSEKYGVELNTTGSFNLPEAEKRAGFQAKSECSNPWKRAYVAYDGKIGPCNHLMNPHPTFLGDLSKQSFQEAWNGFEFRLFRKMIHSSNKLYDCAWCFKYRYGD